jgi:hypothetical protein
VVVLNEDALVSALDPLQAFTASGWSVAWAMCYRGATAGELRMPEDPFEQARREMEQARQDFEQQMDGLRSEFERAAQQFRRRMGEEHAKFESRMEHARQRLNEAQPNRPRGGPGRPGRAGEVGPRPKPPHGGPRRPGNAGPSLKPAPVSPTSPSQLSGGAEAPLDP